MARRVQRMCMGCGADQPPEYGIPDPCLGWLPGVTDACCGHGNHEVAYVREEAGTSRGEQAITRLVVLGGSPAPHTHTMRRGPMWGWAPKAS